MNQKTREERINDIKLMEGLELHEKMLLCAKISGISCHAACKSIGMNYLTYRTWMKKTPKTYENMELMLDVFMTQARVEDGKTKV